MKCLLYCIFAELDDLPTLLKSVCANEGLSYLSHDGLSCVYSDSSDVCSSPSVAAALGYARVNEELSGLISLIPMRYGSVLDNQEQLREFIHKRHDIFLAQLNRLEGCCEMSIRVLPSPSDEPSVGISSSDPPPKNGTAYLEQRRARGLINQRRREDGSRISDGIRNAFVEAFRESKTEQTHVSGRDLITLHFLVPREQMEAFRLIFLRLQELGDSKILLSGPWPPYNFVLPN